MTASCSGPSPPVPAATFYNNTIIALSTEDVHVLRYLSITTGSTAWREHRTSGPAPPLEQRINAFVCAADDQLFFLPQKYDVTHLQRTSPIYVLDFRKMMWQMDALTFPEGFSQIEHLTPVAAHPSSQHHEAAVLFHGSVLIRKAEHKRKFAGDPSMVVLRIDFASKCVDVVAFSYDFVCPVRQHIALSCNIAGSDDDAIVVCGGVSVATGNPNEELFLWRWKQHMISRVLSFMSKPPAGTGGVTGPQSFRGTLPPMEQPDQEMKLSADKQLAPGVTMIFSTMPCEYNPHYYFKMDTSDRSKLVWVGPSTWSLDISDSYRQWKRLRNAREQVCRAGIPPIAGTSGGIVVADSRSGRHFAVVEGAETALYIFHSCDAPARVVPITPANHPTSGPMLSTQMSRTMPASSRGATRERGSLLIPSSPATPRSSVGPRVNPRLHVEPPPPLPEVPMFRTTLLPQKKSKKEKGSSPSPAAYDTLEPEKERIILLGVLRRSKLPVAQPLASAVKNASTADNSSSVLNLRSCLTLVPDELVLVKEVLSRFPHITTILLPTARVINGLFLETLRSLKSVTDVEYPDDEINAVAASTTSVMDELQDILDRHSALSTAQAMQSSELQITKELRRERRNKIRQERILRRNVREQIREMISEALGRLQVEQAQGRFFHVIVQRGEHEAMLHNYATGCRFLALFNVIQAEFHEEIAVVHQELKAEIEVAAKNELKQRTEIVRTEKQAQERMKRLELEKSRDERRKLREEAEKVADSERKARSGHRQDEDQERTKLAKDFKLSLEAAKERLAQRQREEARLKQLEFERQRQLEELQRRQEQQLADMAKLETNRRDVVKKDEEKAFAPLRKEHLQGLKDIRSAAILAGRRIDREQCDLVPLALTITGQVQPTVVAPLRNARWPRIVSGSENLKISATISRVPVHLRGAEPTDPPMPIGELRAVAWTALKQTVRGISVTASMPNLSEGCCIRFVLDGCREDSGLLFCDNVSDAVARIVSDARALTVIWRRCNDPQDALNLLRGFVVDTSGCVEEVAAEMTATIAINIYFCNPSYDDNAARSEGLSSDDEETWLTNSIVSQTSLTTVMSFVPPYIKLPDDDLNQHFLEGSSPLPILQRLQLHVDPIMLERAVLSIGFEPSDDVDESDRLGFSPISKITISPKDLSVRCGHRVFGVVSNIGSFCLAPTLSTPNGNAAAAAAAGASSNPPVSPSTSSGAFLMSNSLNTSSSSVIGSTTGPTQFELSSTITMDMLLELVRSIEFRNDSCTPREGLKSIVVGLRSPLVDMARRLVVHLEGVDNPTEMNLNLAAIAFRAPPPIAPLLAKYITQPLCYVGQYATVVDADTTDFTGGHLRVFLTGGTPNETIDISPRSGGPITLSDDGQHVLYMGDEVASIERMSSQCSKFHFQDSSIAAVEAIVRCIVFGTTKMPRAGSGACCTIGFELKVAESEPVSASTQVKVCEPLIVIPAANSFLTYKEGAPPLQLPQPKMCAEDGNWCGGWAQIEFVAGYLDGEDVLTLNETNLMRLEQPGMSERRASKAPAAKRGNPITPATPSAANSKKFSSASDATGVREVIIDEKRFGLATITNTSIRFDFVRADDPAQKTGRLPKSISKKDVAMMLKHVVYKNISQNPRGCTKIVTVSVNDGNAQATSCPVQIEIQSTDSAADIIVDETSDRTFRLGSLENGGWYGLFDHVQLEDPDSYSFNGATISVELVAGGENNGTDCVALVPSSGGEVSLDKKDVLIRGRLVGKVAGSGAQPFSMKFVPLPKGMKPAESSEAAEANRASYITMDDVNSVLHRISFTSTAARPLHGQRIYSLKFTSAGLTSSAKIPVNVVPCPFVNIPNGSQPRFKTGQKKSTPVFPFLTVNALTAKSGTSTVRLSAPADKRDVLQLVLPEKADLSYFIKDNQLFFEGKSLIGTIVCPSQHEVALEFDATSKINAKHLQFFVRNIHFMTGSSDGFERTVSAVLSTKEEVTTVNSTIQVISDDEPTEIILGENDAPFVIRGGVAQAIAEHATVVDPDTTQFTEPDHIVVSVQNPIPEIDVLSVLGVDEAPGNETDGGDCLVTAEDGRIMARIERDRSKGTLTLRLVDVSLEELQSLVRRIAYKAVECDLNGSDSRNIMFLVRTGRSFSRTSAEVAVLPVPMTYTGPLTLSLAPGATATPFTEVTMLPGVYSKGCSGFVKLSTVTYDTMSTFVLLLEPPSRLLATLVPQSNGTINLMLMGKKVASLRAVSRASITFSVPAGIPNAALAVSAVLSTIAVQCSNSNNTASSFADSDFEELSMHVTDGRGSVDALLRISTDYSFMK